MANNRDYKSQEDSLLTAALSLSDVRWDFGPQFSATDSGSRTRAESGHGTATEPTVEKYGANSIGAGVAYTLFTGAQISMDFTNSLARQLTGDPNPHSTNVVAGSVVQPLLRGAGPLVALESLRQSERSAIYSVRTFQRYRQSFSIQVASKYYSTLSRRDALFNADDNYRRSLVNWERMKMYRDAGKEFRPRS